MRMSLRDFFARRLAYLLPARVIYWCVIRALAAVRVHVLPGEAATDITAYDVACAWKQVRG
jgi:hypothetical protein